MLYYVSWCPLYGHTLHTRCFDTAAERNYFIFLLGQVHRLRTWEVRT